MNRNLTQGIISILSISLATIAVASALGASSQELLARGVLFYLPFEGTPDAAVAVGRATPWAQRSLEFVPGKFGLALHLRAEPTRYVMDARGKVVKDTSGQSVIAYEALGNVFKHRGTLAFWVKTPWAGTDRHLLTDAAFSGPYVVSISGEGIWNAFMWLWRRKSFLQCCFEGERKSGDLTMFGTYGHNLVELWKKDVWQHVAVTWDNRRGYALYFNGEIVDSYDKPIEWDLLTPDIIALGTWPLRGREVWPVSAEFFFDEFLILNRPLNAEEVGLVKEARYADLRVSTPKDWAFDPDTRRREVHLESTDGRPVIHMHATLTTTPQGRAYIPHTSRERVPFFRQVLIEDVDIAFHRRYALIDDNDDTDVVFKDGGLLFDMPSRFRFRKPESFNHLVATLDRSKDSYCFDAPEKPLHVFADGRTHVDLPRRERNGFGIFFKGDARVREVRFFDIGVAERGVRSSIRYFISEPIPANRFEDASKVLLRWPHPEDQPFLLAATVGPEKQQTLTRRALHHTLFVLGARDKDLYVASLRLVLWMRPASTAFPATIRVFDPRMPGRKAFDLDFNVQMPRGNERALFIVAIAAPGLVIPAGGHIVVQLTADSDYDLFYGGKETPSCIIVTEGEPCRIGHEWAQAALLNLWPAYLRRMNQNRFIIAGETEETNPIKRPLDLALKYDPGNRQAQNWYCWARLRPWPAYNFDAVEKQAGPRWAVYAREAIRSAQAVAHWWLDHRSHPNGYLVGGGNQWNDITQLYENFAFLCAVAGDAHLLNAIERYLDAHWNTGRMVKGYCWQVTDIIHSAEEASLLQPLLTFLQPGAPRHFYRDLLTASNLSKWLGVNTRGHTHFRSNFFSADKMETSGVFGRDIPGCESATTPARNIVWYNGHPELHKLLADWSRSWLEDTFRTEGDKPAGATPAGVQFETDALIAGWNNPAQTYEQFAAAFQLSGDAQFLRPFEALLEKREALGNPKWFNHHSLNLLTYRLLTGDASHDALLRSLARERIESCRRDEFFQRGMENTEGEGLLAWIIDHNEQDLLELLKFVARNNRRAFLIYGPTDPPTDRVYLWGRAVLPVMMLGGRLLDGRASDPLPSAAFLWERTDPDIISMVFRHQMKSVAFLVHNFKSQAAEVALRLLRLPEGRYRITSAPDTNADRKPDKPLTIWESEMRRFTPTVFRLQPGTTYVELTCLQERPHELRPDLAVTLTDSPQGNRVLAYVHNLGCAPARNVSVQLITRSGTILAGETLPQIGALIGYEPQTISITMKMPAGVRAANCVLVVDPQSAIDEINESNNRYPLALGVPSPVESSPGEIMM